MLEHRRLRLLPWTRAHRASGGGGPQDTSKRRIVVEGESNTPVGDVRESFAPGPRWLWWFLPRPLLLQVREVEDESLLFTMRQRKGLLSSGNRSRWDICDAEDHPLGTVESRRSWERSGRAWTTLARDRLGQIVVEIEHGPAAFDLPLRVLQPGAPPDLTELGALSADPQGLLVEFAPALEGQPFARMLVLAAVLAARD
jgi:hypothetical protein